MAERSGDVRDAMWALWEERQAELREKCRILEGKVKRLEGRLEEEIRARIEAQQLADKATELMENMVRRAKGDEHDQESIRAGGGGQGSSLRSKG